MPRTPNPKNAAVAHGHLDTAQLKAVDRAVGAQVRTRRVLLGLSQESVARTMDLTFQQLQKYEHGTNRISGSRLFQLATILRVPVAFFFEAVDVGQASVSIPESAAAASAAVPGDVMKNRRTVELVSAFYAIEGEKQRKAALNLLKTLGKSA